MNQPPQPNKRIVSWGEHIHRIWRRRWLDLLGMGWMAVACLFGLCSIGLGTVIISAPFFFIYMRDLVTTEHIILYPIGFLLSGTVTFYCNRIASFYLRRAENIDIGIPLTRANIADLPAPDSLVRASSEPGDEQKAMLLRAATQHLETPPEQLVRAAVGGQEPR